MDKINVIYKKTSAQHRAPSVRKKKCMFRYTIVCGYCRYYYRDNCSNDISYTMSGTTVVTTIVTTVVMISVIPRRYKSVGTIVGTTVAPNIIDSSSYCRHNSRCDRIQLCTIVASTVAYNCL